MLKKTAYFLSITPQILRGIKGLPNAGHLTEIVWNEFYNDWDNSYEDSEQLLAKIKKVEVVQLYDIDVPELQKGFDVSRLIKTRINQYRFRELVMTNYNSTCCITGIKNSELLIASHITSWSKDEINRLNPANGLCLNALHDKAFDRGLITVSADNFSILISPILKEKTDDSIYNHFVKYEGQQIYLPKKFLPNPIFLKTHNEYFQNKLKEF